MTRPIRRHTGLLVAVVVFLVACALIRGGLLRNEHFGDVSLYEADARRMLDGQLPYRDFFVEYPPGALGPFVLPGLVSTAHYTLLFKTLMALCGAGCVLLAGHTAGLLGSARRRALAAVAIAPLAVGPLLLDEYDLWPALTTVAAIVALLRGRDRVGCALLGLGAATKIFPAAIMPAALVWIYRRSGARAAAWSLAAFAAVVGVLYGVFAAVAPGGVWYSLQVQARRGLQKESLGSSVLYVLDRLGLYKAHVVNGAHWTELTGSAGDALAASGTVLQVVAAAAVAVLVVRRRPDAQALVYASAAAVAGFVAFGKVFSPQYLIWLVPLVPLVGGIVELVLLAGALVLTQLWFLRIVTPFDLDSEIWLVVLRDVMVLALFAALLVRLRRLAPTDPERVGRRAQRERGSAPAAPT